MAFTSYAQNYEDVTLWRALQDVSAGFFIDVGAWHARNDSVTLAFSERGWTGVNVEPIPALHADIARQRPRDVTLLAAVGETAGTVEFFEVAGTGLSTTDPALARQHRAAGWSVTARSVQRITLAEICRLHAPADIHFLKLDCEGDERVALAGCDFTRYRPWVVLAEAVDPVSRAPNHAAWEPLLLAAGYRFCWFDGLNRFYVSAERFDALAPRLALPPNVFDAFVRASVPPPPMPAAPVDALVAATPATLSIEGRIALAQSCRDCDDVPKVPDAGQVRLEPDGTRVQVMHNGLKVLADGYCGEWMTRLITLCHGHHEPQEERLFHQAARLLPPDAAMIELGGNWSYYSAWFLQGSPGRRSVILEPDPANRAVGEDTLRRNGLRASFVAATAGAAATAPAPFATERSGTVALPCIPVPALMQQHGIEHLHLLHCDTQGAELAVLEGCRELMLAGRIGLVFISTHVPVISGDVLTHQRCLALLRGCGATIEGEHDPYESFSGDGLIVARFGAALPGWRPVPLSRARRSEALFRDPSFDLAEALAGGTQTRLLADQVVSGVFDALLFRDAGQTGRDHFRPMIQRGGDVANLIRGIFASPEFATLRTRFGTEYLGEGPAEAPRLPMLPADGPLACDALHMRLLRDGPLGRAGDTLVLPNDRVMCPAVLAAGAWNARQVDFMTERLDRHRPYIWLDIGANVGLITRQVLLAFDGITACHCVEPDPSNGQMLRMNLDGLRAGAIHIHPLALGTEDGELTFFRDDENAGNKSLHPDAMRNRPFTRASVRVAAAGPWLAQHLEGTAPILWKSDTQGSDEAIVAATPWQIWRRVDLAVIELWRIRKPQDAREEFLARVADMPNRRIGGHPASVAEVARFLDGDDWAHEDLYLWR